MNGYGIRKGKVLIALNALVNHYRLQGIPENIMWKLKPFVSKYFEKSASTITVNIENWKFATNFLSPVFNSFDRGIKIPCMEQIASQELLRVTNKYNTRSLRENKLRKPRVNNYYDERMSSYVVPGISNEISLLKIQLKALLLYFQLRWTQLRYKSQ